MTIKKAVHLKDQTDVRRHNKIREIPEPRIPKQTPRSSAPTDDIVTGQIPVSQTKRHFLTMSNLSIGPESQGEEGRLFSMPRLEDAIEGLFTP